jgi:hypothetical protein
MIGMAWFFILCSEFHVASAQMLEQKKRGVKNADLFFRPNPGVKNRQKIDRRR